LEKELDGVRKKVNALQQSLRPLNEEFKDLENVQEEKLVDLSEQEDGVKKCENEIREFENQLQKAEKDTGDLPQRIKEYEKKIAGYDAKFEQLEIQSEKLETEIEQLSRRVAQVTAVKEELNEHIAESAVKINGQNAKIEELSKELAKLTEQASKICKRVEPKDTVGSIDKQIVSLEKKIQKDREGKKDPQEIVRTYKEFKHKIQFTKNTILRLVEFEKTLSEHLQERHRRWLRFRKSIARRTKLFFNAYLSRKGYAGSITFDHEQEKLEVSVQLDKMRPLEQQQTVRDTKALSGGERSFSTVALLLSLWEAMETPFRAMDEFDVFMDAVNRRISIEILVEAARTHKNRQYIFITPHDLSQVPNASDISIVRMHPPERGQSIIQNVHVSDE